MKTAALAAVLLLTLVLIGCTQYQAPAAATSTPQAAIATPPSQAVAATPTPQTVTPDMQEKMDAAAKSEPATAVESGAMSQADRDAMAEKSGTGTAIAGPNAFMRVQYDMQGSVSVIERDGKKYLTFSKDFSTKSGPRLVVRLTSSQSPTSVSALDASENVLLADLVDVSGYQEYELPADYSKYESVFVFCEPFRVIWGYASLK